MYDSHSNFGASVVAVAPLPALTGLSLTVAAGQGALFNAPCNCTVWPTASNPTAATAEILRVTAVVGDVLTLIRAQEGSTARSIVVGDQIANTTTVKVFTDIESAVSALAPPATSIGSPEGVVTAVPGVTCVDTSSGDFFVKLTGTGNTGWLQLIDF